MNPQSTESVGGAGLTLPPPVGGEHLPAPAVPEAPPAAPVRPEQAPLQGQQDPTQRQSAVQAVPLPPLPLPASQAPAPTTPTQSMAAQASNPLVADDNDLIEKEWVSKAKEIVEKTRENPYQQSRELNLFKADYMKKRYNKTLKLSE
jgi:hypothetical protein